jgi:hypothetical protein
MNKKTTGKQKTRPSTGRTSAAHGAPAARGGSTTPAEPGTQRGRLQKLLYESIAQMDEEGLVFLLRQAHILSSNANTERINHEIEAYNLARGPAPEPEEPAGSATIEMSPDGKSYFLAIGGARKVLAREELGAIVRVCLGAVARDVGVRNLFRALGRERGDILVDAKISGPGSPHLAALYDTVLDMARKS